jgi:sucrose-6-phosphate hydrolase SacC (GH32 family)
MAAYLFVHFKEKRTPDGEQVYFGISKDGFKWSPVNDGQPVLWSYFGDKGVRDLSINRTQSGEYVILATDLSLAYGMLNQYHHSWAEISKNGSQQLVQWRSKDLIHWSKQEMISIPGAEKFGCLWAPDVIFDPAHQDYVVNWSSPLKQESGDTKAIYYSRTKDFKTYTEAQLLYQKPDSSVIDSAMYEENGQFYLFVKSDKNPETIILLQSDHVTGPFSRVNAFDDSMKQIAAGKYEAPTAFQLPDGKWTLFLDFYGTGAEGQGYVPFVGSSLAAGKFERSDQAFSFPYGFKHGTIIQIPDDAYTRLNNYRKAPSEY